MNYKFRKKPIVIEAFQITTFTRANNKDWPVWLNEAWCKPNDEVGSVYPTNFPDSDGTDQLMINTLEGPMRVGWGDYIIQGVANELYCCEYNIFMKTYEVVE